MLHLDAFTISSARTGKATLRRLILTGWTTLVDTRLEWVKTIDDTIELLLDGETICNGSIVAGSATLVEQNDSGISGSVLVPEFTPGEEARGLVILSYCTEEDIVGWERDLLEHLDDSDSFMGEPRFEVLFRKAKVKIDKMLIGKLGAYFRRNSSGEIDLSTLARPKQLAEVQARYILYLLFTATNNGDRDMLALAREHKNEAEKELSLLQVEFDQNSNNKIDGVKPPIGSRLIR
jgi:hypothetical protein